MTQVGFGPLWRVDGPPPVPQVYGLLNAALAPAAGVRIVADLESGETADMNDLSSTGETIDETIARLRAEGILPPNAGQERWLNGVEVFPYPPDPGSIFDTCSPNTHTAGTKDFGTDVALTQYGTITAYLSETCASFRIWNQEAYKARAAASLSAVESAIVARQFMTGEGIPLNPHLSDGNNVCIFPNADVATNAINALALLEREIGLTGKLGLVHCSPQFASTLRERFAIDSRTGVIRTINGNVVIADAGYARGASPHGHAAATGTQEWIYATGPVDIRRTEMFVLPENVAQALDRGTSGSATNGRPNRITYRAERYYLPLWDGEFQAAVLADRCATAC